MVSQGPTVCHVGAEAVLPSSYVSDHPHLGMLFHGLAAKQAPEDVGPFGRWYATCFAAHRLPLQSRATAPEALAVWKRRSLAALDTLAISPGGRALLAVGPLTSFSARVDSCEDWSEEFDWPATLGDKKSPKGPYYRPPMEHQWSVPSTFLSDDVKDAVNHIVESARMLGNHGPTGASPAFGSREIVFGLPLCMGDYTHWTPSLASGWTYKATLSRVLTLIQGDEFDPAVAMLKSMKPGVNFSTQKTDFGISALAAEQLGASGLGVSSARAGAIASIKKLIVAGFIPAPYFISIGHELLHAAHMESPFVRMALVGTALHCAFDPPTLARVNEF